MRDRSERVGVGPGSRPADVATDDRGLPAFAPDGTDLTVIRWMLSLTPDERLRWLQTHMGNVAALRRDISSP